MLYCCMSYLPETPQLWIGIVLFSKVPKFVDSILTILLTAFTLGKVPECGTHRVLILMWTHVFFNYPCCNKVTVPGCLSLRSRPCTQAQQWASGPCVHTSVVSYNANHCFLLPTKLKFPSCISQCEREYLCGQFHIRYSRCKQNTTLCQFQGTGSQDPNQVGSPFVSYSLFTTTAKDITEWKWTRADNFISSTIIFE